MSNLKPIFHCDAKPFALGPRVGVGNTIPLTPTSNARVEYRCCWVPNMRGWHWPCTLHVFCVYFFCVGSPTRTLFPVEYGLNKCQYCMSMSQRMPISPATFRKYTCLRCHAIANQVLDLRNAHMGYSEAFCSGYTF